MNKQEGYEAAVEYATKIDADLRAKFGEWDTNGAGAVMMYYLYDSTQDEWIDGLVSCSRESKLFCEWLASIAAYMIQYRKPMPDSLAAWTAEALKGEIGCLGHGTKSMITRNMMLGSFVKEIRDRYQLAPTRNETAAKLSACDAVGAAVGLSYKTVEAAWAGERAWSRRRAAVS